jgi:sugar phosphate isomerase/epimerase
VFRTPRRACLGANCLAGLLFRDHAVIDAHRAALDAIAAAGFGVTEISHPGLLSLKEAPLVRRHAEQIGLEIRAVHAPPMRRDPTLARQREAAALAAELGAAILVVHVSSLRFVSPDPAVRARARERDLLRMEMLYDLCAPLGLTLGIENGKHPHHPDYLLSLLHALDGGASPAQPNLSDPSEQSDPSDPSLTSSPPQLPASRVVNSSSPVGLVFDSGHAALRGGDPVQVARAMLPRLVHTHLHDNHGTRDEHLTPGDGLINWPALLTLLHEGGYAGARLLELQVRPGWQPEHWRRELAKGWNVLSFSPH